MNKIRAGLYETVSNLNLDKLKNSCYSIFDATSKLELDPVWIDNPNQVDAPNSTKKLSQYNIFTFVLPKIPELFKAIRTSFYEAEKLEYSKNLNLNYYIRGWVNVYKANQFIDWHGHHYPVSWGWHGFFCVDVEPSNTYYKFKDTGEIITVPSKNNKIVLGLCETNEHKTDPWHEMNRDRITVAFDIIPEQGLANASPNHWIPL